MAYAKGSKPRDMDAACGGEVIKRLQNWSKDSDEVNDDLHPLGTGLNGPDTNKRNYKMKGAHDPVSRPEGDGKSLPVKSLKPRS